MGATCFRNGVLLIFLVGPILGVNQHSERYFKDSSYKPANGQHEIKIELAIVCDQDFGAVFHNNEQKLLNYWKALLWDVHLRFLTVQKVSVSFRVNHIITLETDDEAAVIKNSILYGTQMLADQAVTGFGNWLYDKAVNNGFTTYDIGILATGKQLVGALGVAAELGGACSVDTNKQLVESALVVSMHHTHIPSTLAHEIGHLLGAPHDTAEEYKENNCGDFNATNHQLLMTSDGNHTLFEYFFSNCSQVSIQKFLQRKQAGCLRLVDYPGTPLIDTSKGCSRNTFSKKEQCKIIANDTRAFVLENDGNCIQANCYLELGPGLFSTNRTFDIFEGTECSTSNGKGHCFRGSCILPGGLLVNGAAGSEYCLGNENSAVMNDSAVIKPCHKGKTLTPLDLIRVVNMGSGELQLRMIFSNVTFNKTEDKCLAIRQNETVAVFVNCTEKETEIAWEFKYTDFPSKVGFSLFHPSTQQCLAVSGSKMSLETVKNCTGEEHHRWQFLEENELYDSQGCKVASSAGKTNFLTFLVVAASFLLFENNQ